MRPALRRNLEKAYSGFFEEMGIDADTGCLDRLPGKKFATYPYVGSKYGDTKKILFVGLDIGKDPRPDRIQSFDERRASIEGKPLECHNPHMAGTYMTALYFLKDGLDWDSHWRKIIRADVSGQKVLRYWDDLLPSENPLSYCALTNYHKFVKERRSHRSGGTDRSYLNRELERKLLNEELEALNPDIVVFQSEKFEGKVEGLNLKKKAGVRLYVGPHPSNRSKGGRKPNVYVSSINPLG